MNLTNKVILVTGASSGIGQAIAIEAAKHGAVPLILYRKNRRGAKETFSEVKKYSKGDLYTVDLTDLSSAKNLFAEIKKDYPIIDLLVNNAGEATAGEFDDYQIWDQQLKNIFMSQVYVTNEFIAFSKKEILRKIVNISSIYGLVDMGNPDFPQYSAAKAAVVSLTMNLAKKYAPHILVNAVAPGYTWTPPWKSTPEDEQQRCIALTKIGRFVQPQEIAQAVISLFENDAITGEILRVDGGIHLQSIR